MTWVLALWNVPADLCKRAGLLFYISEKLPSEVPGKFVYQGASTCIYISRFSWFVNVDLTFLVHLTKG